MKILTFKIILLFSLFNNLSLADQNEVPNTISFDERRTLILENLIKRFTGTYEDYDGSLLTLRPLPNFRFDLRHLAYNDSIVSGNGDFNLDFTLENSVEEVDRGSMGKVIRDTVYQLKTHGVIRTVTHTNKLNTQREIIITDYQIGTDWKLRRNLSRRYYKRKYKLFGDWVEDTDNYDSRVNTIAIEEVYDKLSPEITDLFEVGRKNHQLGFDNTIRVTTGGSAAEVTEKIHSDPDYINESMTQQVSENTERTKPYFEHNGVVILRPKEIKDDKTSSSNSPSADVLSISDFKVIECKNIL